MKYIKQVIGILACVLILTGCSDKNVTTNREASLLSCTEVTEAIFVSEYADMKIIPDYLPVTDSFFLTNEFLYFVDRAAAEGQSIYKVLLQGEAIPEKLPIDLDGAVLWALAANEDKEEIYCIGHNAGEIFFAAYHLSGEKVWMQSVEESAADALNENMVTKLICDSEGRFYAFSGRKIFLFDGQGVYQGEILCPEKSFVDICQCGDDRVYVTYKGAGKYVSLAEVYYNGKTLAEGRDMLGNGKLYPGIENTMLICDDTSMYSCNPETEKLVKLYDLAEQGILSSRIQALKQIPSGDVITVTWDIMQQEKPIELCVTTQGTKQESGKQQVTLMCFNVLNSWDEMVFEFNKQSKEYEVIIENIPVDGDFEAYINTRLSAQDSPDLMMFQSYQEMQIYQERDVLENLNPFMEKSEKMQKDMLIDEVMSCLEVDDKLYGVARSFSIDTLMGKEMHFDKSAGWTVAEYLAWLKQNPQAKAQEGLKKEYILEYCLKGSMDAYIETGAQGAHLNENAIRDLLMTIGGLQTDETEYWDSWNEKLIANDVIISRLDQSTFSNHGNYEHDNWVYMGYPTEDGTPCHFIEMNCMSILSNSTCKDGAFAFMEYYMAEEREAYSINQFYTNAKFLQEAEEAAKEERVFLNINTQNEKEVPVITDELLKRQKEMLKCLAADTHDNYIIRSIIIEEAQAYFEGAKGLEETCDIIQNRVQLYMDENEL